MPKFKKMDNPLKAKYTKSSGFKQAGWPGYTNLPQTEATPLVHTMETWAGTTPAGDPEWDSDAYAHNLDHEETGEGTKLSLIHI